MIERTDGCDIFRLYWKAFMEIHEFCFFSPHKTGDNFYYNSFRLAPAEDLFEGNVTHNLRLHVVSIIYQIFIALEI